MKIVTANHWAEGGAGAADKDAQIKAQAQSESERLLADARQEADKLQTQVNARREDAVRLVLDAVTAV